jgi:hypothetical protein
MARIRLIAHTMVRALPHRPGQTLLLSALVAALSGVASPMWGQTSASHTVTVQVAPVSAVAISGGDVTLTLSEASPSSGEATASDATTCDLHWISNQPDQKITVATDLASPRFALRVEALNPIGGRSTGQVTLRATDQDFVVDVERGKGWCDLSYTATTDDLLAARSDVHTVVYTITDAR